VPDTNVPPETVPKRVSPLLDHVEPSGIVTVPVKVGEADGAKAVFAQARIVLKLAIT
jgi:hypothetical protein